MEQSVIALAVFLLLASSCSCSRQLHPWLTDFYSDLDHDHDLDFDLDLDQIDDYGNSFGDEAVLDHSFGDEISSAATSFNVMDYGAAGNGQTDDCQAFIKAWRDACSASTSATIYVPPGKTFLLNPVVFEGPCKANSIHFQLQGTLIAPASTSWADNGIPEWIRFSSIDNLLLDGNGKFDGQGSNWWKPCTKRTTRIFGFDFLFSCQNRPRALHFHNCNGLRLNGLTHVNSPMAHISVNGCKGVHISNINIIAPEDSPNTDGIDISGSTNVNIQDSKIGTGDDCIAINGGSSSINISGLQCGPGHGISIGSLGYDGAYDTVEDVHVENSNLRNTQNGVRIKTYQGGSGYARKISFDNIRLDDVKNPIIIDQFYQDKNRHSGVRSTRAAVRVSDVTYSNIRGTSASDCAIDLKCSNVIGCSNIAMLDIDITSAVAGKNVYSTCNNARGRETSVQPKVTCI